MDIDNTSQAGNGGGGNSLSWNHTIRDGVSLIVAVFNSKWNPPTSFNPYTGVTFNGQPMTLIDRHPEGGSSKLIYTEIWALWTNIPGAGTYTISATGLTPNARSQAGIGVSFFNIKQVGSSATSSQGFIGTHPVSQSITVSDIKSLILTTYASQNGGPTTPGGGQTDIAQIYSFAGETCALDISYEVVYGAQTISGSADNSNPEGEVIIVSAFPYQEIITGQMM